MKYDLPSVLRTVTPLIEAAGARLRQEFFAPAGIRFVDDAAIIDTEVETSIRQALVRLYPEMGFRAEEDPSANRLASDGCRLTWLLDPHDGTKAAGRGYRGSSLSLGLIRDGVPVLGVVFAYAPPSGGGDLIAWAEGMPSLLRNGRMATARRSEHTVALVSKHADRRAEAYVRALDGVRYLQSPGIAYRLARVAAGDAEVAMSLSVPRDFDCAGGHALLIGAGLDLYDERGEPIRYGEGQMAQYGYCFGGDAEICQLLAARDWADCRPGPGGNDSPIGLFEPLRTDLEPDDALLNRAQGCWLGQLVGDSLGSQVEFQSPETILAGWPSGVDRVLDGGIHSTIAGQMTDDSELASHLAARLIEDDGYSVDAVALGYRDWYRSGPFDVGGTIRAAVAEVTDTDAALSARSTANSASQANGALMRCSPLGIATVRMPEAKSVMLAREDARLTHPNQVCVDANAVFVASLRRAILGVDSPEALHRYAVKVARQMDASPVVIGALTEAADGPPSEFCVHMGWVIIALRNAFFELLSGDSVGASLTRTVGRGGDTDTNACIAGALLGAMYGLSALPGPWVESVLTCRPSSEGPNVARPRPHLYWPADALIVAERLLVVGRDKDDQ